MTEGRMVDDSVISKWIMLAALLMMLAACGVAPDRVIEEEAAGRPNILLIVADDMGFSDVGAFGGEIATPNIDSLASAGVMFTQFHAAPNCGPTRGSLMTGLDPHRAGLGGNPEVAAENQKGHPAYQGFLRDDVVTMAEVLQDAGYRTSMAGKWHLGKNARNLPGARGFDRSFALLNGAASHWADQAPIIPGSSTRYTRDDQPVDELPDDFYSTVYSTDRIIESIGDGGADERPFFAFLSYTAPHNPLHVPRGAIDTYRGRYDAGWDALADERRARLRRLGLLGDAHVPHPRPEWVEAWHELTPDQKAGRARDMEIYAAMIDVMDQNIGRVLRHLKDIGQDEDTLVVFMSDNGPSMTTILDYISLGGEAASFFESFDNSLANRGGPGSSTDIGPGWAYASATPNRLFKGYVAQGGIRVPLILRLGGVRQQRVDAPVHVMDLMPTILELAGVAHPGRWRGQAVAPIQGLSLVPLLEGEDRDAWTQRGLGWSAYGMDAFRRGDWKVLRLPPPFGNGDWQLYNLAEDPGEVHDLAGEHPELKAELAGDWEAYAEANEVIHPDQPVAYGRPVSPGKY